MKRLVTLFCIMSLGVSYQPASFAGQRTKALSRNSSTKQQRPILTKIRPESNKTTTRKLSRKRNKKKKQVQQPTQQKKNSQPANSMEQPKVLAQESIQQKAKRNPFKRSKRKQDQTELAGIVKISRQPQSPAPNLQEDWKNVVPMASNKHTLPLSPKKKVTLVADKSMSNRIVFTKGLTVSPAAHSIESATPRAVKVKRNYQMSGNEATRLRQELNMYKQILSNTEKEEKTA